MPSRKCLLTIHEKYRSAIVPRIVFRFQGYDFKEPEILIDITYSA